MIEDEMGGGVVALDLRGRCRRTRCSPKSPALLPGSID
jgi:hypothetical protein